MHLTRCVTLIPTPRLERPVEQAETYLPLQPLNGRAVLKHTYDAAVSAKSGEVIVITPTRAVAEYCRQRNLFWRPVKDRDASDLEYCQELVLQFRPPARVNVQVIVHWPWFRPLADKRILRQLIKDASGGVASEAEDEDGCKILGAYPIALFLKPQTYKITRSMWKTNLLPVTAETIYGVAKQLAMM